MTTSKYAYAHEGRWQDGQLPKISGATYIVSYDQRNDAYHIDKDEYDDFVEWVAAEWEQDNDPRQIDEDSGDYIEEPKEYLDRIGVTVREA